ncbi:hypothetical protein Y032_0155g3066 [Ancylostoma ceylanicum]|uniref:Uncharacterized protein n=1 Tax=Ancylostoma ceylanicum TaxID=53326 RepID=A0A016SZR0_9BILA|nr:hypothetical protein Y032_0155g3066 [Ancylostoma ceylanicum]
MLPLFFNKHRPTDPIKSSMHQLHRNFIYRAGAISAKCTRQSHVRRTHLFAREFPPVKEYPQASPVQNESK